MARGRRGQGEGLATAKARLESLASPAGVGDDLDCLLYGGYAGGNVGDEIALAVALEDARARFGPRVAVLTRAPEYTSGLFPGVAVVPYAPVARSVSPRRPSILRRLSVRWRPQAEPTYRPIDQIDAAGDPLAWVRRIRSARHLYLVGGGYLNDVWDVYFSLLPIWIAVDAGVPISTAPIQLGPFFSKTTTSRVVDLLRGARIVVRDRTSLAFCRENRLEALLAVDDVFRADAVIPALRREETNDHPLRLGVCIYRQNGVGEAFDAWWIRCLRALKDADGEASVEGFAFHNHPGYDTADMKDLFVRAGWPENAVLAPPTEFREPSLNLRRYHAIIACRFHAVVVAHVIGVPALAVAGTPYYRAKLTARWPDDGPACRPVYPEQADPTETAADLLRIARKSG